MNIWGGGHPASSHWSIVIQSNAFSKCVTSHQLLALPAGWKTQETNLELGFPANVVHVVTPDSPLYNLSLLEMDTRMMEVCDAATR